MNINDYKGEFEKIIEFLKHDISGLRTGRASTVLVEDIAVTAYGTKQPMKATATISVADPKTLTIEPWDKSLVGDIEKAIRDSGLGLNPINDGRMIRLCLPDLTVERRQELIKVLHTKQENARISIRHERENVKDSIQEAEKNKQITEDERYSLQDNLDKMVKDYNELVKDIGEKKEAEINSI